jgi:hypothetical protein
MGQSQEAVVAAASPFSMLCACMVAREKRHRITGTSHRQCMLPVCGSDHPKGSKTQRISLSLRVSEVILRSAFRPVT